MAFLIVEKGHPKDVGKRFPLAAESVTIGRETTQNAPDIALNDEYVSRRHAEITFDHGRFVLRDLGSTNGTTADDRRIEPGQSYRLKHDSVIGLGVASGTAYVLLRFKESPTVSTARIEPDRTGEGGHLSWLRLDTAQGEVWVDQKPLTLSRKEYDLLLCLAGRAGRLCNREELIARVWPEAVAAGVADAAIDQLVHRLRLKIEPDPEQPARLISRKGFGYTMV
jgi:hypothetical protein